LGCTRALPRAAAHPPAAPVWILTQFGPKTAVYMQQARLGRSRVAPVVDVLLQLLPVWVLVAAPATTSAPPPDAEPQEPGVSDMSTAPLWVGPNHAPELRPVVGKARVRGFKLKATRIDDALIEVDGRPTERAWLAVPTVPEMVQVEPRYGNRPTHDTEVRIAYGSKGLYVAFVCQDDPKHVRAGV